MNLSWEALSSYVLTGDDRFCFYFHRRQRAVILINLGQDENLSKRLWQTGIVARQITIVCSGMLAKDVGLHIGQHSSDCCSHCGPVCQMFGCRKSSGDCPREIRFAGLLLVGTWRQSMKLVLFWISATRFATKVLSACGDELRQWRTIVESVQ